jgi:hypothetical protein
MEGTMPDASDQKGIVFDQSDILGLIIPGAALLFGGALVFDPKAIQAYSSANFGSLGIVVLAALVAGQCLRVIAWTYFDKTRHATPRLVFEDVFRRQPPPEKTTIERSVVEAYAVRINYEERFWDLSMYAHIYSLLRVYGRSDSVDRMERQFRMVSGLFVASVLVGVAYVLNFKQIKPDDVTPSAWSTVTTIAWVMLGLSIIALLVPSRLVNSSLKKIVSFYRLKMHAFIKVFAASMAILLFLALYGMKFLDTFADGEILILLTLFALSVFLYVGSIRFANAVASALLISFSGVIAERKNKPAVL